jgi:prevent-host-death family protein
MKKVNLAEAKAHPSELVAAAAAGEPVCIMRRGEAVAQLTAAERERRHIDAAVLRAITDAVPPQREAARDFVRRMRDDDRY